MNNNFNSFRLGTDQLLSLGIEQLLNLGRKKFFNRRVGLLSHPAGVNRCYFHSLDLLRGIGTKVEILFGPEHGFSGEAQDMEAMEGPVSHLDGIPLRSLYGSTEKTLSPSLEDLKHIDVLAVDLQDVGARYYTFVWTALLALRACRDAGIEMIVADRPNPLGGINVEGTPQKKEYLSFVGLKPVAVRHGMTIGELLTMAAIEEGLSDHLTVVKMNFWKREKTIFDLEFPWVMPSPNMPTAETAFVYPGMCLIEGTEMSEGRGTTRPFELVGSPNIDSRRLAKRLSSYNLPGVVFRPTAFKPMFHKHKDKVCGGVQVHVTNFHTFLPYLTGVAALVALKAEARDAFSWRKTPYEFVSDIPAVDLLTGSSTLRTMIDEGAELKDIAATWREGEKEFMEYRREFLLYD